MVDLSEKINSLAVELREKRNNSTRFEVLQIKLCKLLQKYKGFADIYEYEDTYQQRKDHYYDPLIFAEVYMDAFRDFCDPEKGIDKATGEKMEFLHLFNIYYKVKEPDIKTNQYEEASYGGLKEKRKYLRYVINTILHNHQQKSVSTSYNVFHSDNVEKMLQEAGASEKEIESYFEALKENLSSTYVTDEESGDLVENDKVAKTWAGDYFAGLSADEDRSFAMERLIRKSRKAMERYKGKRLESAVRQFMTIAIYYEAKMLDPSVMEAIRPEMDLAFLQHYVDAKKENPDKSEIDILAEYIGYKHDSARKLIKRVKDVLKTIE